MADVIPFPSPSARPERSSEPTRTEDFLWWRDGVIYQIYPRSFMDSDGDGVGDLQGLIDRLDYLAGAPDSLGVDALWLSPIYPSPGHDFGYDISDYENIDPLFGSLEVFDALVKACHARGIRVVMDLVMNHTSHQHPWFLEARSSLDNPKRDWYLWQNAGPGGRAPNHWRAVFGGRAWEWDETSQQFYYHMFLKEQPDLNWRNPQVVARLHEMIRFWMKRGVDGFRLDVVNCYFKDEKLRANPFTPGLRPFDMQRHVYDRDRPELVGALQGLRRVTDEYPETMMVGEVMGHDAQLAARYVGNGHDQLHQAFNFTWLKLPWKPNPFLRAILDWEAALPPGAWPCHVLNNHDVDRFVTRAGGGCYADARAKVAATLLLTMRGTPYLYYGEELGLPNTPIPRGEIVDPPGKQYWPFYLGRDPARTPMPWDGSTYGGFSTAKPWLRLNKDVQTRNVAVQKADPTSIFNVYRHLLKLRRTSLALRRGMFRSLQRKPKQMLAYLRVHPQQTMLVLLNFSRRKATEQIDATLPEGHWRVRFSTHPGEHARLVGGRAILQPNEAVILEKVLSE